MVSNELPSSRISNFLRIEEILEAGHNRTRRKGNGMRECTARKCVIFASCLLVLAVLVAIYVGLVCQRMELTVLQATASGLNVNSRNSSANVIAPNSTSSVIAFNSTASVIARNTTSSNHNATSSQRAIAIDASFDDSAPMLSTGLLTTGIEEDSAFYLSKVALTLSLLFKNPTRSMGTYHYEQLHWRIFYHNLTIADGSIDAFSQGSHHAHLKPIRLHLLGENVTLTPAVASALQANRLNLQANTTVRVRLLGKLVDYVFPVSCNLNFPQPKDGNTQIRSKTSCIVKEA